MTPDYATMLELQATDDRNDSFFTEYVVVVDEEEPFKSINIDLAITEFYTQRFRHDAREEVSAHVMLIARDYFKGANTEPQDTILKSNI